MRSIPCLMLAPALLAGCHPSRPSDRKAVHIAVDDDDGDDGGRVSVEIPGVDAKLALPGMNLARHVDLDGIQLAPDTHVRAMDVAGRGQHGRVLLSFSDTHPPEALLDHYRRSAERAGYHVVGAGPMALSARKGTKHFVLTLSANGDGTITLGAGG